MYFCQLFDNLLSPSRRFWDPRGPMRPKGLMGGPWGPWGPPWGPKGAQWAQAPLYLKRCLLGPRPYCISAPGKPVRAYYPSCVWQLPGTRPSCVYPMSGMHPMSGMRPTSAMQAMRGMRPMSGMRPRGPEDIDSGVS